MYYYTQFTAPCLTTHDGDRPMTRSFLRSLIIVFALVGGSTACTHEVLAPTPIYDTISLLPLAQPTLNLKVGEVRGNLVMLCLPRGVNVVTVDVSRSTAAVEWMGGSWGLTGASCEGARDLFSTYVALAGQEVGEAKITLTFTFTRGNPKMVNFKAVVTAGNIIKG